MMQIDAQLSSDLLWVSGGLLELEKCSYRYLHFDFKLNGWSIPSVTMSPDQMKLIHAQTGKAVEIPYKSVFNPHKTLGHYKTPAGTGATQIQVLKEKAEKYALQILTSLLSTSEAHLFYHSIFQKSLGQSPPLAIYFVLLLPGANIKSEQARQF
eukprot:9659476-Ditylum_brightwellii.AAC.1